MEKPGYKTTEFWLTTLAVIVGLVMSSGILEETETIWDNKIVGLIVSILAALGYTAARAVTKMSAVKGAAIVEAAKATNGSTPTNPT